MRIPGLILAAGALMALPLLAPAPALAHHHHHHQAKGSGGAEKVDSAAYPKAPGGMPAASDKGKPIETKTDAGTKPAPSDKAGTESAPEKTGTPSAAYPNAPTSEPAAGDGGKPVKP